MGIDVAKEKHHAFFGTATGKTLLKRLVFDNNREGFERLGIQAEALRVQHSLTKVVFGLEPTANYHKPLISFKSVCMVTFQRMRSRYGSDLRFQVCASSTPPICLGNTA